MQVIAAVCTTVEVSEVSWVSSEPLVHAAAAKANASANDTFRRIVILPTYPSVPEPGLRGLMCLSVIGDSAQGVLQLCIAPSDNSFVPRDTHRLRFSLLVAMMATSGVALMAQGTKAIPLEILAVGELAGEAMVDLVAETISAPDAAAGTGEPAKPVVAVLIEGESTSSAAGGWNRYPRDVAANMGNAVAVQADGVNGARISDVLAEGPKTQFLSDRDGHNVAVLWIGINDISEGTEPVEVYAGIKAWASSRRGEGWDRIALVTVPKFETSISASNNSWGSHELADSMRSHLNEMIVANSIGADVVVDLRSVIGIGDDFGLEDKQWRPDRVHFTAAGYALVAAQVTAALQSLAGF